MNRSLDDAWRAHAAQHPFQPIIFLSETGLLLGAGSVLARFCAGPTQALELDLEGDHDRVIALLAVATKGRVPPDIIDHLSAAAGSWRFGDKALANIRLAFTGLPKLEHEEDAYRLFLAETLLANAFSPSALMKALCFTAGQTRLLRYAGQPHIPAGNGRASGQFGSGRGAAIQPVLFHDGHEEKYSTYEEQRILGTEDPLDDAAHGKPIQIQPAPAPGLAPFGIPGTSRRKGLDPNAGGGEDDDEPKRCPSPAEDKKHNESDAAKQYAIDGHNEVNKLDPLKDGEAILFHGVYYDDCARTDDPQGRWKAGDMIEFKGSRYAYLLSKPFALTAWTVWEQAFRQDAGVQGTGRRDVYLIAEAGALQSFKSLLGNFKNIDIFHFAPVTPVVNVPKKKSKKVWNFEEGAIAWS